MASKLGQRVRELRTTLKWSQAELAAAADVEQSAVSRIEVRPGYEPGVFTLYRICRALDTSMDELLAESVEFTPNLPQDAGMESQLQRMVVELGRNQLELASILQSVRDEVAELRKTQFREPR